MLIYIYISTCVCVCVCIDISIYGLAVVAGVLQRNYQRDPFWSLGEGVGSGHSLLLFSSPWVQLAINMQLAPHITCRRISSHRRYAWPALPVSKSLQKPTPLGTLHSQENHLSQWDVVPAFWGDTKQSWILEARQWEGGTCNSSVAR